MKNRMTVLISMIVLALAGALYAAPGVNETGEPNVALTQGDNAPDASNVQDEPEARRCSPERLIQRLSERLELSDEQRTEIRAIFARACPRIQPILRDLARSRRALRAATARGRFDAEEVRAIATRIGRDMSRLIVAKARVRSLIRGVLTSEQQEEADRMEEEWESHMRDLLPE